ncbi:hypothetical protein SDC9_103801 [bioreactor metagenome]|uniref:Uncharacterized protein n=1 Tax=bioreactor metagenome TaxID=1076179 RepID=A0A645B5H6_9ZZZZ
MVVSGKTSFSQAHFTTLDEKGLSRCESIIQLEGSKVSEKK